MYDINTLDPIKKHWLLRTSNIPRRFLGLEPSDIVDKSGSFPGEVSTWIQDTVDGHVVRGVGNIGINGVGLLFDGGPGIGKTTHAVVAAMEVIRNLPSDETELAKLLRVPIENIGMSTRLVAYYTYPEFLSLKKSSFELEGNAKADRQFLLDGLHGRGHAQFTTYLLILDDLGKEYGSSYNDSSFDEILRLRYDKGLPTIVTTNVKLEDWEPKYGEAMSSFANEAFIRVPIIGSDLRGAL